MEFHPCKNSKTNDFWVPKNAPSLEEKNRRGKRRIENVGAFTSGNEQNFSGRKSANDSEE